MAVRSHVMQQLEKADVCDDPKLRQWYLTFIVVGGGYSGTEVAGSINDLVRGCRRFFANISADEISVKILHTGNQLLPEIDPQLREFARSKLEKAGVEVILNARVVLATPERVWLEDGRALRGATIVCTIGTGPSPFIEGLAVPKRRERLLTEPDMRLLGFRNAWAAGDCAWIVNAFDNKKCMPTGQFAERQGRQVAQNIMRVLRDQVPRPFRFRPLGQLCCIGPHTGVAEFRGLRISGLPAWFLWRTIYLFKLPSWSRRAKVGFDWAWDLVFSRDLAHLKTDQSTRVSRACYHPGDYIFRQGDPGGCFYVIEKGEVEVLQSTNGAESAKPLRVLSPGDFFGEIALIQSQPRSASVRARTPVQVVVMGRQVFTQLSRSLAPLRKILAEAVKQRTEPH